MKLTDTERALFRGALQHMRESVVLLEQALGQESRGDPPSCPACEEEMELKDGKYGPFYGCPNYPDCSYLVGAKEDGSVKGTPANQETRTARAQVRSNLQLLVDQGVFPDFDAALDWLYVKTKKRVNKMSLAEATDANSMVKEQYERTAPAPVAPEYEDDLPF